MVPQQIHHLDHVYHHLSLIYGKHSCWLIEPPLHGSLHRCRPLFSKRIHDHSLHSGNHVSCISGILASLCYIHYTYTPVLRPSHNTKWMHLRILNLAYHSSISHIPFVSHDPPHPLDMETNQWDTHPQKMHHTFTQATVITGHPSPWFYIQTTPYYFGKCTNIFSTKKIYPIHI